jgi:hypothetical protein
LNNQFLTGWSTSLVAISATGLLLKLWTPANQVQISLQNFQASKRTQSTGHVSWPATQADADPAIIRGESRQQHIHRLRLNESTTEIG